MDDETMVSSFGAGKTETARRIEAGEPVVGHAAGPSTLANLRDLFRERRRLEREARLRARPGASDAIIAAEQKRQRRRARNAAR